MEASTCQPSVYRMRRHSEAVSSDKVSERLYVSPRTYGTGDAPACDSRYQQLIHASEVHSGVRPAHSGIGAAIRALRGLKSHIHCVELREQ